MKVLEESLEQLEEEQIKLIIFDTEEQKIIFRFCGARVWDITF